MVLIALSTTECTVSQHKGADAVQQSLTEEAARRYIFQYLQRTANEIGVKFSLSPDGVNHATAFEPADTMPCYDGHRERGPHQVQALYWVAGVPPGQTSRFFSLLRDTWKNWGWKLDPKATNTLAALGTPDHYTFIVQDAGKGDGWLSIVAASPCFPYEGLGAETPAPDVIEGTP
ncbi:hypothetical protein ACFYTQ_13580 [Nocardia sp. NPDC004068]|uniref:hypothetical protein n=1 Tax=Nocardia sp. NPDC004068 TaxID=3364303 RepID=UPI00367CD2E7